LSESIPYAQKQPTINEQVELFTAIFLDLRKVLGAGFKHAHRNGFSTTQYMALGVIGKAQITGEPCTISSMAVHLGIDPATVVRTVDSLEKRGLVERRRSREDRRQVFVDFTDAGLLARQEVHQQFIDRIHTIFLGMSAEGRASLLTGLEEFIQIGLRPQQVHSEEEL
jgi:DNA-binding MarR family transcriptional regulator